jgi:hypothetical protein
VSEYPWGPHGPRVDCPGGATPNPTPFWVEPTPAPYTPPAWSNPAPSYQKYGGGAGQPGSGFGSAGLGIPLRVRKTLWFAIPLAWFFGPLGLLYAIGDSRPQQVVLAAHIVGAILVHNSNYQPTIQYGHPILLTCVVWSIFASWAYNRRHFDKPRPE